MLFRCRLAKPAAGGWGDAGVALAVEAGVGKPAVREAGVPAVEREDSAGRRREMLSKTSSPMTPFSRRLSSS